MSPPKLFTPIKIGRCDLEHRIVLAPLTRFRANSKHVHGPLAVEYYGQRASVSPLLFLDEPWTES
jgi:NADPH2 dehydrogenase